LHLDTVIVDNHISIQKLAMAIQSTPEEIRLLNPSLKKGIIPFNPNGVVLTLPYHQAVRVAALRADTSFQSQVNEQWLALSTKEKSVQTAPNKVVYKVRAGDNLAKIAKKHDVSVAELKKWNKKTIKGGKVNKGQKINIYPNRV
jgi:membrane-bound lytic murein transglycosylase D